MTEIEKLRQQVKDLKTQLKEQNQTNATLKQRAFWAIVNGVSPSSPASHSLEKGTEQAVIAQASQIKSTFLENVSHEIRTSMNGIVGMTNLVLKTDLSKDQRDYLVMVNSSVERLLSVVNQVLDFSKIETGQLDLSKEDFNLKESLDHDLYVLRQAAQAKGLELSCNIGADVPTYINGDAARMVQILTNLVDNGIQFTTDGSVTIDIKNGGYDNSNHLLLKFVVTDTGCGISGETKELIVQYFQQKAKNLAPQPLVIGAAGLGLTIASQLVNIMGGAIGFESDSSGTHFWFSLPFKEVADYQSIEERGNRAFENIEERTTYALKSAKVLLAEDEYINRVILETILNQLEMEVTTVENGEKAVEEFSKGDYNVVLMDVQMDQMDGLEATREIRKLEKESGSHLPVIALTALAMPGDREKCLQAGMDDYLPKPVERDQLIDVLNKHLRNKALVVVSEIENQQLLVRTLIKHGWQVTIAETRRSAMYEASLSHFELIILDISMVQLESFEAVKIMRQLEEYSGRRSMILGIGGEEDEEKSLKCGIDGFLGGSLTGEKIRTQLGLI